MSLRRAPQSGIRSVTQPNKVRQLREEQLLTKAELSRKAGISPLTLTRIEGGRQCRVDTKRKIILALGLTPSDRAKVFGAGRGKY
jgi:DNA-binding XRE family transcriptional regulator